MSVDPELADPETLYADGLEVAFLGLGRQFNRTLAVYSTRRALELFESWGMSPDEAQEHFEFNVVGAWVGEWTPVFLDDTETELGEPGTNGVLGPTLP